MTDFNAQHKVTLKVAGRSYAGWHTVDISYGIETAARSFAFTATQPGISKASPVHFHPGDLFELFIGTRSPVKLITGYIDALAPQYDANTSSIAVTGRSKTGQIIDCSVIGKKRFNNLRIEQIAAKLCAPYGIEVVTALPEGETTGEPVPKFVADHGEKVFESIERVARLRSLLIYDDAQGRLVLQKGALGSFPLQLGAALERGRNVLSGDGNFDLSGVYNEYRVRSQRAGDDQNFGEVVSGVQAVTSDDVQFGGFKRILVMPSDSSANAERALAEAQWQAANRYGRSTVVNYTHKGWLDDSGGLYQPATVVAVDDSFMRVNAGLLIVNVGLRLGNDGTIATLSLAPEAGYFAALPEKPRQGIGAWRSPV